MPTVFINYRREESSGEARALFNDLVTHLGEDAVFMDVDSIAPGQDFRDVVHERVATCDVMLSLVGKEWLTVTSRSGARRLDDPGDFVRLEIEAALKRKIPVAPVLLHGAEMPAPESLPEALRDFAFRNAFELSHTRWESDVDEMLRRLRLLSSGQPANERAHAAAPEAPPPPVRARSNVVPLVLALVVLTMMGSGAYVYFTRPDAPAPLPAAASAPIAAASAPSAPAGQDATQKPPAEAAASQPAQPATPSASSSSGSSSPGSSSSDAPAAPTAPTATPAGAVELPLAVPLALGNQLAGQDSCLERLVINPCANVPAQRWRFEADREGMVRIHNANAGPTMCLDLVKEGNNTVPAFASCGPGGSQRWSLMPAGAAARYFLVRNDSTGADQCLTVSRRLDQTLVLRMVNCLGGSGQRWRITPQ